MDGAIGPGDIVECIEPGGPFKRGTLYHVSDVTPETPCDCITLGVRPWAFPHAGLLFHDAPKPRVGVAWCCLCFRPISRRSDFEKTLEQIRAHAFDLKPARTPLVSVP